MLSLSPLVSTTMDSSPKLKLVHYKLPSSESAEYLTPEPVSSTILLKHTSPECVSVEIRNPTFFFKQCPLMV